MYQIQKQHLELIAQIEENEGELTPEIENALALTESEFHTQAISVGFVIKKYEDDESVIQKEIDRLTALKETAKNKREFFKSRLDEAMKMFNIAEIKTPTLKLSYRKSEAVEIVDASKVPFAYVEEKVTQSISKTKIKDDIKAGVAVPGAILVEKQNLQIR